MIEIIENNSTCKLTGVDTETFEDIKEVLSYEADGAAYTKAYATGWNGKYYLLKKDGTFPTGLMKSVIDYLVDNDIDYKITDDRVAPEKDEKIRLHKDERFTSRPYQIEAANLSGTKNARGIYLIGTGGGKTYISALIIDNIKVKTLFITPDVDLRTQTYNVYENFFPGLVSTDIESNVPIVVCNYQAVQNTDKTVFEKFKCLMIDEFHHSGARSYEKINRYAVNAYYRYGFTGTLMRSDEREMVMQGVISDTIYTKTTSELIYDGYLVPPDINIFEFRIKGISRANYQFAYNWMMEHEYFHKIVSHIASKKISENKQTIILVRRVAHGEILEEMIEDSVFLNGGTNKEYINEMKEKFNNKEVPCIIATNIFGEGTDIPNLEVLINARLQKTEIQTKQGIGRSLRLADGKVKAEVYDFSILGQKHLRAHSLERIESYKSEPAFNVKIHSIENKK